MRSVVVLLTRAAWGVIAAGGLAVVQPLYAAPDSVVVEVVNFQELAATPAPDWARRLPSQELLANPTLGKSLADLVAPALRRGGPPEGEARKVKRAKNLFVVSPAADYRAFCQSLALGEIVGKSAEYRSLRLRVDAELLLAAARPDSEELKPGAPANPQGSSPSGSSPSQGGPTPNWEPPVYTGPDYYRPEYDGPPPGGPDYGQPHAPADKPQIYQQESREQDEFHYDSPTGPSLHGDYFREQRLQSLFGTRPSAPKRPKNDDRTEGAAPPQITHIQLSKFRVWTDSTGRRQTEARLIGIEDNRLVVLEKTSGSTSKVPLKLLSPTDLKYVAQQIALEKARAEASEEAQVASE